MNSTNRTVNKKVKEKIFTIFYLNVNSISEKFSPIVDMFSPIVDMFNCKLAYSIPHSLKNFIKKRKRLVGLCNQNIVYKIPCDNCDVIYVEQKNN